MATVSLTCILGVECETFRKQLNLDGTYVDH
jgi:hypothetical protein